ncbi:MAG: hypothetical protein QNK23_11800 [Crocinitomicaceae bacterium]|nr:hypothetical protein [Crocinitomicaceae bacterium]
MKLLACLLLLLLATPSFSQDFMYLEEIKLKKEADYVEHQETFVKAIDLLMSCPIDDENLDRLLCQKFIITYAEGSPLHTISLDESISSVIKGNDEILVFYIGLWVKSLIENSDQDDSFHTEFVYQNLYEYCKKGNGVKQTKTIKSLIKHGDDNDIDTWINEL